jgi:hypothetical protein
LDAYAALADFRLQRLTEVQNEGLRPTVGAIEGLRHKSRYRPDVDDGAAASCDKAGHDSAGKAHDRHGINPNDLLEEIEVGVHKTSGCGDPGVVNQNGDAVVIAQPLLDLSEIRLVV